MTKYTKRQAGALRALYAERDIAQRNYDRAKRCGRAAGRTAPYYAALTDVERRIDTIVRTRRLP